MKPSASCCLLLAMITTLPADSLDLPLDLSVEEEEQLPAPVLVPFTMGGNEPNCGATDVTALTPAPAGKHGWVRVNEEGHFVDGENRRIRFLGVNLTFGNAFPDHETAEQLGRRLASMGINAVRIPISTDVRRPAASGKSRNGSIRSTPNRSTNSIT